MPWSSLKPTYRGKEKNDAKKVDLKNVKRFSIMSRRSAKSSFDRVHVLTTWQSFFGDQEGDFSLTINSIKAVSQSSEDLEGGIMSGQNVRRNLASNI